MNYFWNRCFCCGGYKNTSIIDIWNGGSVYVNKYYHLECVHEVLCNPVKYTNKQISIALTIVERNKRDADHRKRIIKCALEKCVEDL